MTEKKSILYAGHTLTYRVTGKGKPVMLVHGFGEEATIWNGITEVLDDAYCFILPDLPGSGDSELIPDMSMSGMAEALLRILREEGIDNCPVIGHSMGGYITLALVEKYPDAVSAFGLFHSTSYADSREKIETRRKGMDFIREHGAFAFLKTVTPNLFSPLTREKNPDLVTQQINELSRFTNEALLAYYEGMIQRPDRTPVLQEAGVPVLFIIGASDNAVSPDDSLQQSHLPGISYIHLLEKSGHMGMLEETAVCSRIMDGFLQGI